VDLTPPGDDAAHVAQWVTAGILTPEEAAQRIAMTKSDNTANTARLMAALLERL